MRDLRGRLTFCAKLSVRGEIEIYFRCSSASCSTCQTRWYVTSHVAFKVAYSKLENQAISNATWKFLPSRLTARRVLSLNLGHLLVISNIQYSFKRKSPLTTYNHQAPVLHCLYGFYHHLVDFLVVSSTSWFSPVLGFHVNLNVTLSFFYLCYFHLIAMLMMIFMHWLIKK